MIIDEYEIFLMDKYYEFRSKIAYDMGLRPVFKIIDMHKEATHTFVKTTANIDGKEVPITVVKDIETPEGLPAYPDSKEIEDYLRDEDFWIAGEILKHYNWDAFCKYCVLHDIDDIIKNYTPCMGADGQCQMDCVNYFNCRDNKLI